MFNFIFDMPWFVYLFFRQYYIKNEIYIELCKRDSQRTTYNIEYLFLKSIFQEKLFLHEKYR